jgi:two-component system nitrogen regulation response regulator NtrX
MKDLENRTILVVDDVATDRRTSRKFLESEGYSVKEAENWKDAVCKIREGGLGLVILGVKMSEADNRELIDTISCLKFRWV